MVCLATGRPVRDVVMGVHKPDGSVTWILINAEPLPAPADGPVSVVTVFTEITALQTALEATSLSAARFRALAECSADVVLEASPEGMLSWVSPSVTALLGWQPDDLKGRSLFGLLHPDDLPRAVAAQRRLAAGETLSLDGRVRTSEGGFRWLRSRVCPVVDESGALIGRVGSWLDIEAEVAEAAAGTSIDPWWRCRMPKSGTGCWPRTRRTWCV